MIEQLLDSIKALQLEHLDSNVSDIVTVSIGLATQIPTAESTAEALVDAADQQLYRAKNEGRARYCAIDLNNPATQSSLGERQV